MFATAALPVVSCGTNNKGTQEDINTIKSALTDLINGKKIHSEL